VIAACVACLTRESDFEWMGGLGFRASPPAPFVLAWSNRNDWMEIDVARVEAGRPGHRVRPATRHSCQSFASTGFRVYCVNGQRIGAVSCFLTALGNRWTRALAAAVHHCSFFAKRYQGIPSAQLSFDLLNEPPWMSDQTRYVEIVSGARRGHPRKGS